MLGTALILCHHVGDNYFKHSQVDFQRLDRGQGLNHAISDASHFVDTMKKVRSGKSTLEEAVKFYSLEIVERGAHEVHSSVLTADMVYDWNQLLDSPIMQMSLDRGVPSK